MVEGEAAVAVIFYRGTECSNDGRERLLGVGLTHEKDGRAWCTDDANACKIRIESIVCRPSISEEIGSAEKAVFEGDKDGSDNWNAVKTALGESDDTETNGNYPAWEWVNGYAKSNGLAGEFAQGWYLPTVAELSMLYRAVHSEDAMMNTAIGVAGGIKFDFENMCYWSSSVYAFSWPHTWQVGFDGTVSIYSSNNDIPAVCAIRDFSGGTPAPAQTAQPQPTASAGGYAYSGSDDIGLFFILLCG